MSYYVGERSGGWQPVHWFLCYCRVHYLRVMILYVLLCWGEVWRLATCSLVAMLLQGSLSQGYNTLCPTMLGRGLEVGNLFIGFYVTAGFIISGLYYSISYYVGERSGGWQPVHWLLCYCRVHYLRVIILYVLLCWGEVWRLATCSLVSMLLQGSLSQGYTILYPTMLGRGLEVGNLFIGCYVTA